MRGYNGTSGLQTDLYELTMAAGYVQKKIDARATFELSVRHLPVGRNYLVAAGLDQALEFLGRVRFSTKDISYICWLPAFRHISGDFLKFLGTFRFTGDVWALPEGTIFFAGEPLIRVTAPIAEAQLVETSLLSILHLQTLVASKAARVVTAALERPVVEFGSRRAHGVEAGVLAARAAYLSGCAGTSNAYAGKYFGIPVYGTQAHSWIMAHQDESSAFSNFLDVFPDNATLLVDTYDVRAAVSTIVNLGRKPYAIRLDSGDVLADSQWCREFLDASGWNEVKIFVSGDLDEHRIATLLRNRACIDSFGVGTSLVTSSDAPSLSMIYKLVEIEEGNEVRSALKLSEDKKTYPGRKQVFRFANDDGTFRGDLIELESEPAPDAEPLLVPVMRNGRRLPVAKRDPIAALKTGRDRFLASVQHLPAHLLSLQDCREPFPVHYGPHLQQLRDLTARTISNRVSVASKQSQARSRKMVFWEVDVQNDFVLREGRLCVPGAEEIIPNIDRLVEACRKGRVFLISSADAHNVNDPEFSQWPPHCLKGTTGAELIPEAQAPNRLVIPNQEGVPLPRDITSYQQIVLEKNTLDVFDNPNTDALLSHPALARLMSDPSLEFIVFGVATEHCVRVEVEGLLRRGRRVTIVSDAIRSLDPVEGTRVLEDLRFRGARVTTTGTVLASLSECFDQTPSERADVRGKAS
jgi:nicotinate phosphoribosyltransferase